MPAHTTIHLRSAEEFLEQLRRSNDIWWQDSPGSSPWVFRGIGDAENWLLIPSAWRKADNRLQPLISRIAALKLPTVPDELAQNETPTYRSYCEWVAAEHEALYQFASEANELGFDVEPGAYQQNRSPINLGKIGPLHGFGGTRHESEIAVVAQHHGIPTRLLDWSRNPLVAAFFAASRLCRPQNSQSLCVWAMNSSVLAFQGQNSASFGDCEILLYRPARSTNEFLHSQGGVFTEIIGRNANTSLEKFFLSNSRWPTMEEIVDRAVVAKPILLKYELDCVHADRLLTLLDREGINRAAMMPTLDNVSRTVRARWQREA